MRWLFHLVRCLKKHTYDWYICTFLSPRNCNSSLLGCLPSIRKWMPSTCWYWLSLWDSIDMDSLSPWWLSSQVFWQLPKVTCHVILREYREVGACRHHFVNEGHWGYGLWMDSIAMETHKLNQFWDMHSTWADTIKKRNHNFWKIKSRNYPSHVACSRSYNEMLLQMPPATWKRWHIDLTCDNKAHYKHRHFSKGVNIQ